MPFTSYKSIAAILQEFPLTYQERDFLPLQEFVPDELFRSRFQLVLAEGVVFNSEAAICEAIIAPILWEIWRHYYKSFLLWSHQPLYWDEQLSGVPDYLLARRSPRGKVLLEPPYLMLIEAKRDDFEAGWGQCLAAMLAARNLNDDPERQIFGGVSNGKLWEFGALKAECFTKNTKFFSLDPLEELMGALYSLFSLCQQQL